MLSCKELCVYYPIRRGILNRIVGQVRAVDGVTLSVGTGETLGLVGESGCGKTTLGRALIGLEPITSGVIEVDGKPISSLKGKEKQRARRNLQMVFQDPFSSLDPRMSAMDIVTEGLDAFGLYRPGENRESAAVRLLKEVGLEPEVRYRYPHEFSGGQRQRLSIARAISMEPAFIVCDEPVSALDVSVQAQIIKLLIALRESHGLSYLFISHDLSVVRLIAQKVAVMYLGRIVEFGNAQSVLTTPLHPYTQALVSAIPVPGKSSLANRILLPGELPSPANPPGGCAFHTRCPYAKPACVAQRPELQDAPTPDDPLRQVACPFCNTSGQVK